MKSRKLLREAVWFGAVGVAGFLADVSALYVCRPLLGLYVGRGVSFLVAVAVTWSLNRRLTFAGRRSGLDPAREFGAYLALMLVGGSANLATYALLVALVAPVRAHPILGVAAGSLAGMLLNWLSARLLLFR